MLRRGAAFVVLRKGDFILLRSRPEKGLLGGMTEVPGTEWTRDFEHALATEHAPLQAAWRRLPGVVTHTFTHFPLELVVYMASVPTSAQAPAGARWTPLADIPGEALPNVMRKVVAHALGTVRPRPDPRG